MRRRVVVRTKRRSTQWGSAVLAPVAVAVASNYSSPITPSAVGTMNSLGTPTLMRIRGVLRIINTGTSGQEAWGAAGIIVVNSSAQPLPYGTDASKDWLWHKFFWLPNISGSSVEARLADIEVDSKAMRKIQDTDDVIFVLQNATASTSAIKFFASFRLLVKTP